MQRYLAERRAAGYANYRSGKAMRPLLDYLWALGSLVPKAKADAALAAARAIRDEARDDHMLADDCLRREAEDSPRIERLRDVQGRLQRASDAADLAVRAAEQVHAEALRASELADEMTHTEPFGPPPAGGSTADKKG